MNRFDIALGAEPPEEPKKEHNSILRPRFANSVFYLRRDGGEEIKIYTQDLNVNFLATHQGPELSVSMTFPLTTEQSKKLMI